MSCDCIYGSILDGIRQPILFTFISNKPSGYKVFCRIETIPFRIIKKSVLNTVTFCLENDKNEEADFNGETSTFTLQFIKIGLIKKVFKNLKLVHFASAKSTIQTQKTLLVR